MNFREKIESGKFIVTSEIGPPKGIEVTTSLNNAEILRGKVDGINVTDCQNSMMRLSSLAVCLKLKEHNFEPIFQMTCRDRNRIALQSDILAAASLGLENISIVTGDHPLAGDHPEAKAVFDLDSVQLLQVVKGLESGVDMKGNKLTGVMPEFFLGAAVNPGADPLEPQIIKMEKKIEAGAEFFQTQAVFDISLFEKFISKTRHLKVPVIAGIILLKSGSMARYMNQHVAGIHIPDNLIQEIEEARDKQAKSVEIAVRLIKELKPMCRGLHLMPIGWDKLLPTVLDVCGL